LVEPLRRRCETNVLWFDLVLMRTLAVNGQGFAATMLETQHHFLWPA
jgi:hypothetical protein